MGEAAFSRKKDSREGSDIKPAKGNIFIDGFFSCVGIVGYQAKSNGLISTSKGLTFSLILAREIHQCTIP